MLEKPKKIAICFMSNDINISNRQYNSLDIDLINYELEIYNRSDINPNLYNSFSQMINDAINETDSEFMIFINPKTIINSNDINLIIEKLCSGYCFASLFGFAFFGITKELIRNVGLLDESFIGSEYEDDDFIIRMRLFGKKVYWGQDWSKYDFYQSSCPPYRGSSLSYFWKKWRWKNNTIINSNISKQIKQISLRHRKNNYEILNSWGDFKDSWGEGSIWDRTNNCIINEKNVNETIVNDNIKIITKNVDGNFYISMNCNHDTAISFFLVNTFDTGRKPIHMNLVYSNTWYSINHKHNEDLELRLYHDGILIYINNINNNYINEFNFKIPISIV